MAYSMFAGIAALTVAAAVVVAPSAAATTGSGQGTVALPPGGPIAVYPQDQAIGGADPLVPFGTDPFVPYGTWAP